MLLDHFLTSNSCQTSPLALLVPCNIGISTGSGTNVSSLSFIAATKKVGQRKIHLNFGKTVHRIRYFVSGKTQSHTYFLQVQRGDRFLYFLHHSTCQKTKGMWRLWGVSSGISAGVTLSICQPAVSSDILTTVPPFYCREISRSSDEYLNYAENNLAEWKTRGEQVVAEMVEKVKEEYGK